MAEALTLLLAAAGCSRGAAYVVHGGALELVDHAGMTADLERALKIFPAGGAAWFTAQRAMRSRTVVVDHDITRHCGDRISPSLLTAAGWDKIVACPIVSGGLPFGVIVLAAPAHQEIDRDAISLLEIGCNFVALHLERRIRPPTPLPGQVTRSSGAARDMGTAPTEIAPALASGTREKELSWRARSIAEALHRVGPRPGAIVLQMLRNSGLSQAEAFSVLTFALSTGILVRDAENQVHSAQPSGFIASTASSAQSR